MDSPALDAAPAGAAAPAREWVEHGIYRQTNGRYAVCVTQAGRPCFRTIGPSLEGARQARIVLAAAARRGELPLSPRTLLATVVGRWIARFEARVAAGERRPRTLDAHRYHLNRHILPPLGRRRISALGVEDIVAWLTALSGQGCSEKTRASALATLHSILRYARRNGWILQDPVALLEPHERPRPMPRAQRVLDRKQIAALLDACLPTHQLLVTTILGSGMRISEALGLTWTDIDFAAGAIHVRKQLSVPSSGDPARRVPLKTKASQREIPLVEQLARMLAAHRDARLDATQEDWVFMTHAGTAHAQRNVTRRGLRRAARLSGIDDDGWPPLRFHDLRHTFASHQIIDLNLDVAQVSRILGHAHISTTLDIYTHLFDQRRHTLALRERMASSAYAELLELSRARGEPALGASMPPQSSDHG